MLSLDATIDHASLCAHNTTPKSAESSTVKCLTMLARKMAMLWLIIGATGCTAVMYEGDVKSDSELSTIESDRTAVVMIDGRKVPYSGGNFAKVMVLPGVHSVTLVLNDNSSYGTRLYSLGALNVMFLAEAGRTYVTRPFYMENLWMPEIVEKTSNKVVSYEGTGGSYGR